MALELQLLPLLNLPLQLCDPVCVQLLKLGVVHELLHIELRVLHLLLLVASYFLAMAKQGGSSGKAWVVRTC